MTRAALLLAMPLILLSPTPAEATISCTYTASSHSVYANVSGNDQAIIVKRIASAVTFNNVPCSGATVFNTAGITIGGSGPGTRIFLDLTGGPFAPGSQPAKLRGDRPEIKFVLALPSSSQLTIIGSSGNDHIVAGTLGVLLDTDKDVDLKLSGPKLVKVDGGAGDDWLFAQGGGAAGAPVANAIRIVGGSGNDVLYGGSGNDRLEDGPGTDGVNGGDGDDLFISGGGRDAFSGGSGDDTLRGAKSFDGTTDNYYGNDGMDTIDYSARSKNVCVTTGFCPHSDPDVVPASVEVIVGGKGNDFLEPAADGVSHRIVGGPGDDVLLGAAFEQNTFDGGPGNDRECGGLGDDRYISSAVPDGGDDLGAATWKYGPDSAMSVCGDASGVNTVDYSARSDPLRITLDALQNDGAPDEHDNVHSGITVVIAGAGDDALFGNDASNTFYGGPGNDSLTGGKGQDLLHGGDGNDAYHARDGLQDFIFNGPGSDYFGDIDVGLDVVAFGP